MAEVKGVGVITVRRFLEADCAPEEYEALLSRLSQTQRREFEGAIPVGWYDVALMDELWSGLAEQREGRPGGATAALLRLGAFIARDNLNTLYRIYFRLARPSTVISILPRMWKIYFRGIVVNNLNVDLKAGQGLVEVEGLGALRHIGVVASGWKEFAYQRVGAKTYSVTERAYEAGRLTADPLRFDVRWSG